MSLNNRRGSTFRWVTRAIKYYLLGVFSFVIVCALAFVMDLFPLLLPFLPMLIELIVRFAALLLIFVAITVVIESLHI